MRSAEVPQGQSNTPAAGRSGEGPQSEAEPTLSALPAASPLPMNATWLDAAVTANHLPFYNEVQAYDAKDRYVVQVGGDGPAGTQAGTWTYHARVWRNITGPGGPSPRVEPALAYDSTSKVLVLFGGFQDCAEFGCTSQLNDTWEFSNGTWTQVPGIASAPSARGGAAFADDPSDGGLLLFGGASSSGQTLNDTWTFSAGRWTQLHPAQSPPSRVDPGAAYDANESDILVFGGYHLSVSLTGSMLVPLNDTWTYSGDNWTSFNTSHAPAAGNYNSQLAYDSFSGRVVAADRASVSDISNVTWEYAKGNWSTVLTSGTLPPVGVQNVVMDASDGYLLDSPNPNALVGRPDLGFANGTWSAVDRGVQFPSARWNAVMAPDPDNGSSVLFGGHSPGTDLRDTWLFNGLTWQQLAPATPPPASDGPGFAYSPSDRYDVLFGGLQSGSYANDTWKFSGGQWQRLSPARSPPALFGSCLVDDPAIGGDLLFGGYLASGHPSNETWTFAHGNWTNVSTARSPPARGLAACAYDGSTDSVIVFGGGTHFSFSQGSQFERSDTWSYSNRTWSNLTGPVRPPARDSALLGPLDVAGESGLLLEGGGIGLASSEVYYYDTWFWNDSGWTRLSPSSPGPAVVGAAGTLVNATGSFEAFGGITGVAGVATPINETVAFDAPRLSPRAIIPIGPHSLEVAFSANASGEGTPAQINWSYGDGATGRGPFTNHTYSAPGDYRVTTSLWDRWGLSGSSNWILHLVAPSGPLAVTVTAAPEFGVVPLAVTFEAHVSGGVPPFKVNWSFGDGSAASGTDVTNEYSEPGNFTVLVNVTDDISEMTSDQLTVQANASGAEIRPQLSATLSPTVGYIPLDVRFNVTVGDPYTPILIEWQFGDGTSSTAFNGSHRYSSAGTFFVQVIARDADGQNASQNWTVEAMGRAGTTHSSGSPSSGEAVILLGVVVAAVLVAGVVVWRVYRSKNS